MFKHAARGVPVEVLGLCIGKFIDDYTVYVSDVFAVPQRGSTEDVETIDETYHVALKTMLEAVGIKENVVGWFHSHPGYFCWLSSIDRVAQQ